MDQGPRFQIEILNDETTTFDFVIDALSQTFGFDEKGAESVAEWIDRHGSWKAGPFAEPVARALHGHLAGLAEAAGVPFTARVVPVDTAPEPAAEPRERTPRFTHELLARHFARLAPSALTVLRRTYPIRLRADLQRALDERLGGDDVQPVGVEGYAFGEAMAFSALMTDRERSPATVGPVEFEEVDTGGDAPLRCHVRTLWCLRVENTPVAVLVERVRDHSGRGGVSLQVATPGGAVGEVFTREFLAFVDTTVHAATAYRGKVLSLEPPEYGRGRAAGVAVHALPAITRDEVILPEATLQALDRGVIGFARARSRLRALGQSGRKGLLFHGPPGTGKTHTLRYLAASLPDHTTLLMTAEQVGLLAEYFQLARLLQPSIVVIEDADLIARQRQEMDGGCEEVLLNQLLNEMDGLRPDAAVFVVLTTNRPEAIEGALAQRPGRVDQAIPFPLPDGAGRRALLELYGGGLALGAAARDEVVARTEGVSPAFLKELTRRLAQFQIESADDALSPEDVDLALREMLLGNDPLGRTLLGAGRAAD